MNGLITYGGVVTKIRAMQGHLLSDEDFRTLSALPDVQALTAFLREHPGYKESLSRMGSHGNHREPVEQRITDALLYDYVSIYHFSSGELRNFLKYYARRFEVRFIKSMMTRAAVLDKDDQIPLPHAELDRKVFYDNYTCLDFERLTKASSIEEVLESLADTPYAGPLRRVAESPNADMFRYETAIDLFYFSEMWKSRKEIGGADENLLTEFLGTRADLLNMWQIHRARTWYRMDPVEIYAITLPMLYRISKNDIRSLVEASSEDQFEAVLKDTWYARKYPEFSSETLPHMYTAINRDVIRSAARRAPYSIATPYYYLYSKEHEIYRLTSLTECLRYSIPPEETYAAVIRR